MTPKQALTLTVIAPEVKGFDPIRWINQLSGVSIAGVDMRLVGGPNCYREEIARAFEQTQDVFLWVGHGMPGGLAIPDREGQTEFIPPKWLATQVKCAAPRLFILAACNSLSRDEQMRSMAEAISLKGVNVIGYTIKARQDAAFLFNTEIIRMMARGADIGDAFCVALEAIEENYPDTAAGVFLLPGLTNGLSEIRGRLDRLEEAVQEIRDNMSLLVSANGTAPRRQRERIKAVGC